MFGYVKPYIPDLKVRQNELYKAVYCTLCKRQKKLTGAVSSFSLSYDFVFLALVRSAITGEKFNVENGRCAYNPLKRANHLSHCDSIDYTACVAGVLSYYKIKDDIADSKGLGKLKYLLLLPFFSHIRKKALKHNVPDLEIKDMLDRLSDLEKQKLPSPDATSEIFGELLGLVASYGVEDLEKYALTEIFTSIGKWIYIIDAVDDLYDDIKKGSYNPFIDSEEVDFEIIKNTLQMTLTPADNCILKIKFYDDDIAEIIKNIILLGTAEVEDKVINKAIQNNQQLKGKNK